MELLPNDSIGLLYLLLPGFLAAWVFYGLTAHPKRAAVERVIEAFIFTILVRVLVIATRKFWWVCWHSWHPTGIWTEEKELVWSVFLALLIGFAFAYFANQDWAHRLLRRLRVTKRTSYPSEWYSGFSRYRRDVVLHLKGERRLKGWAEEWPDQCDRRHFLIEEPAWLDESGKEYKQSRIERLMVQATDVEMVEFWYDVDKIPKTPDELEKERVELASLQKPDATSAPD